MSKSITKNKQNNQNFAEDVSERPLNPTRNAADLLGDTSGLTGITRGSPQQTGAEPDETVQEDSFIQGGKSLAKQTEPNGIPKEAVSDDIYNEKTFQGRSRVSLAKGNDMADEPQAQETSQNNPDDTSKNTEDTNHIRSISFPSLSPETSTKEDRTNHRDDITSPTATDAVEGEEWVGGDMPHPESDDDTLANAQFVGMQLDEDEEHPQELDIARDVDRAEQALRET